MASAHPGWCNLGLCPRKRGASRYKLCLLARAGRCGRNKQAAVPGSSRFPQVPAGIWTQLDQLARLTQVLCEGQVPVGDVESGAVLRLLQHAIHSLQCKLAVQQGLAEAAGTHHFKQLRHAPCGM